VQIPEDRIDRTRAEWAGESPDLDTAAMDVMGRILRIEHLAAQRIRHVLRAEGLDPGGFDVLATLRRSGAPYQLTPTALYRELVLTSGAITHRIDTLERAGLVKRGATERDRRSNKIGLTAKGKTMIERAMEAHMKCEQALLESLSRADRKALTGLLRKLLHGMEKEPTNE
jgi:DNA-binding MarR family transcriptional regulator